MEGLGRQVDRVLDAPLMQSEVEKRIEEAFSFRGSYVPSVLPSHGQRLKRPTDDTIGRKLCGYAHGLLEAGDSLIPIIVEPVGATPETMHRLSEQVQMMGKYKQSGLGPGTHGQKFIVVRRETCDPWRPAKWTATVVDY